MDQLKESIIDTWLRQAKEVIEYPEIMNSNYFENQVKICNDLLASSIAYDAYRAGRWSADKRNSRVSFANTFANILDGASVNENLKNAIHELYIETLNKPVLDMSGEYRPV